MVLGGVLGILFLIAAVTFVIDPYFHYHKPLEILEYPLVDERYINDGITRNHDYEAMITGTSMTQNFKASQMEELWQLQTIKTCYSGATFHEVNAAIRRAISYNPKLKYVLCSLDGSRMNMKADKDSYENYPEYLFDNNPFNDVNYLWNKEVLLKSIEVINYTRAGKKTTSMDEYGRWSPYHEYGKEAVEAKDPPAQAAAEAVSFTKEDEERVRENITENYLKTALENPEITFYYFLPPYSCYYWERLIKNEKLERQLETEMLVVSLMLEADNVQIYGFADRLDITKNLDNYTDILHYGEWINEEIMNQIYQGEGRLTKDNYQEYYHKLRTLYNSPL